MLSTSTLCTFDEAYHYDVLHNNWINYLNIRLRVTDEMVFITAIKQSDDSAILELLLRVLVIIHPFTIHPFTHQTL